MSENSSMNSCPEPKGILLIVGGKEDKGQDLFINNESGNGGHLEVLQTLVELIKKDNPRIEIVTTASSQGTESFEDYQKAFEELKITNLGHLHHENRQEVDNQECLQRTAAADAFFFSGGDQLKLTSVYGGSEFLNQLKNRYIYEQVVIGGTSAGAMALSTPMIYAGSEQVQQIAGEIKITTGLEFLKDVCIDTHFISRSRFVRMAQVIASNPTSIGLGVEENTAMIVRRGTDAEVVGSGIITVIEGFFITRSNLTSYAEKQAVSIRDLRVHLLARGDQYQIPKVNPPHF